MTQSTSDSGRAPHAKLGSVGVLDDGRKFVHFERHLPGSIANVWVAISDPEHLVDWFPGLKLERRVGGHFDIWFSEQCEGPAHVTGTVTRYEPPKVLECGTMRFELAADGPACKLTFTDILHYDGPLSEPEVINSVLGGWHKYLDMLEFALLGGKSVGKSGNPRDEPEFDYSRVPIDGRDPTDE